MSKSCNICGGLIMAQNEVLGYGGPLCSGNHATVSNNESTDMRKYDLSKASPMTTTVRAEVVKVLTQHVPNKLLENGRYYHWEAIDALLAIYKGELEKVVAGLPEKKKQPDDPKTIGYNQNQLEGYNVAISEVHALLLGAIAEVEGK